MAIFNGVRIDRQGTQQVDAQVQQGKTQLKQIQTQLDQATTPSDLEKLMQQFNRSNSLPKIEDPQKMEAVKKGLVSSLSQGETTLNNQAQTLRQSQRMALIKNSVKWNLGALVSGALFIWIWFLTDWSRRRHKH